MICLLGKDDINIRNTEEAVWGPQYSPRLSCWPRSIGPRSVWWPRGVVWSEYCLWGVSYIYYPTIPIFQCYLYIYALSSDEPEVFLTIYSQTAITHAGHFRRVVKPYRPPAGRSRLCRITTSDSNHPQKWPICPNSPPFSPQRERTHIYNTHMHASKLSN